MLRRPFLVGLIAALLAGGALPGDGMSVRDKSLAINDLHGHMRPQPGGIRLRDPQDANRTVNVAPGGGEFLASALRETRDKNPKQLFVAARDLVGANPLLSALLHDEPIVEALVRLGLAASAVGNHEFDRSAVALVRLQRGCCHAAIGCQRPAPYPGARFLQYLAASTVDTATDGTIPPAYAVRRFEGVPVAFIGLTLKDTPRIMRPSGVAGLSIRDESATVNALTPGPRAQGVEATVVLIHQRGYPASGPDECPALPGTIVPLANALDRAVDVVITGHTHRADNCRNGDMREAVAHNVILGNDRFAKDAAMGEPSEAVAMIALTNPCGLRTGLAPGADDRVRYEDLFVAQPFSNQLVTMTLTGAQLQQALEQQWLDQARPRVPQVSRDFSYAWDEARQVVQRIVPDSLHLNEKPIEPERCLRVTGTEYLASGGDNFSAFRENGTNAQKGIMDFDALEQFFRLNDKVTPGALDRIRA